jgi:hypothetical protein
VQPQAYLVTTSHGESDVDPGDLLDWNFIADQPGVRLAGNINCLRTSQG